MWVRVGVSVGVRSGVEPCAHLLMHLRHVLGQVEEDLGGGEDHGRVGVLETLLHRGRGRGRVTVRPSRSS